MKTKTAKISGSCFAVLISILLFAFSVFILLNLTNNSTKEVLRSIIIVILLSTIHGALIGIREMTKELIKEIKE